MLQGGVSDPANKLTDKSYAASSRLSILPNTAPRPRRAEVKQQTPNFYSVKSGLGLVPPTVEYVKNETAYYLANIGSVRSIDDLMANSRSELRAGFLWARSFDPGQDMIRKVLEGGVSDPQSANTMEDKRYAAFAGLRF